jgi:DNA polymerase
MQNDPWAELEWLSSALRGHLEWAEAIGTAATPPIDETWLERRRAQYRALQVEASEPGAAPDVAIADQGRTEATARPANPSAVSPRGTTAAGPAPLPPAPSFDAAHSASAGQLARSHAAAPEAPRQPDATVAAKLPVVQVSPAQPPAKPPSPAPVARPAASEALPRPQSAPGSVALFTLSTDGPQRLALVEAEVRGCTRCRLSETRTNTVFSRGTGKSGLCFVGEGPGADEDAQGSPFVGVAGQLLDRMIVAMGLERDDVYVCNIVKCRPPGNRKPEPDEMTACESYLTQQLEILQPKVIVALGATATSGLLGVPLSITRLRGNWRLYRGKVPVMPTFHPSYLLRQPAAKREVWGDLLLVLDHLGLPRPAPQRAR